MPKAFFEKYLLLTSIIVITLLIIVNNAAASATSITKTEAFYAPDNNFFNEIGEKVYLDQYEGKTVLLVFWATWCGACISEIPSLDILQKDFKHFPFEVLAVSQDFNGVEAVINYFKIQEIRHLNIYHDYQNQLFKAMNVVGLPTAFLIDPSGKVKVIFKGPVKWHEEEIRNILLAEIDGNPTPPKNSYKPSSLNNIVSSKKPNGEQINQKNILNDTKEESKNEDNPTKK